MPETITVNTKEEAKAVEIIQDALWVQKLRGGAMEDQESWDKAKAEMKAITVESVAEEPEGGSDPKSKFYNSVLKADDDEEGTFTATITTGTVDRDKEIIVAKGIDFENFLKNPVVMFGHDHHGLPIGKALWVKSSRGGKIIAKVKVAPTEFAQEVFDLIKGGFLGAVSIGFRPIGDKNGPPKPEEVKKNPGFADARFIFRETELLEFSVVNVPANPEALITAVSKGVVSMSKEMSDVLDIDMDAPVQTIMRLEQKIVRMQLVERVQTIRRVQTIERFLTDEQIAEYADREIRRKKGRAF